LKRCFPELIQGIQDVLTEVEIKKQLLENKKQNFQIRKENCSNQVVSLFKRFEIEIEEEIQVLQDYKQLFMQQLEQKGKQMMEEIQH
jgi:hypothetical protein